MDCTHKHIELDIEGNWSCIYCGEIIKTNKDE